MVPRGGDLIRDRLYIGGDWAVPSCGDTIAVLDPTTEEVIGSDPEGHRRGCRPGDPGARDASRMGTHSTEPSGQGTPRR